MIMNGRNKGCMAAVFPVFSIHWLSIAFNESIPVPAKKIRVICGDEGCHRLRGLHRLNEMNYFNTSLEITSFCISEVPSPMVQSLESR
ncbi:hypothetical protein BH11BAC7_BH11BAC7_18330 [soil metagenome]